MFEMLQVLEMLRESFSFQLPREFATDAAGNTNVATTADFIINTVIQLTLTNQYQAGINPVVGGNNATVVQSSNGASIDLTGQGGVTRANHSFAGWSLVTTNGSGAVIPSPFTPTVPLFLYSYMGC